MVLSVAQSLSRSALRNLPFIEAAVARGISSTALQTALTQAGRGMRRTDLLTAIRRVRGIDRAQPALRSVRRDRLPDPVRIPIAATNIRRQFSFRMRIRGTDMRTGERVDRFVTITSDTVLSRDQLERDVEDLLDTERENYQLEPDSITLMDAVKRA